MDIWMELENTCVAVWLNKAGIRMWDKQLCNYVENKAAEACINIDTEGNCISSNTWYETVNKYWIGIRARKINTVSPVV